MDTTNTRMLGWAIWAVHPHLDNIERLYMIQNLRDRRRACRILRPKLNASEVEFRSDGRLQLR